MKNVLNICIIIILTILATFISIPSYLPPKSPVFVNRGVAFNIPKPIIKQIPIENVTLPYVISSGGHPYLSLKAPNIEASPSFSLRKLEGSKVVINFMADWCSPCMEEMPYFRDLTIKRKDVKLVMVAESNSNSVIIRRIASGELILDYDNIIFNAYQINGIPVTFFLNEAGIIKRIKIGAFINLNEIEFYVDSYGK